MFKALNLIAMIIPPVEDFNDDLKRTEESANTAMPQTLIYMYVHPCLHG